MDGLYRDILLDHYKNSPYKGAVERPDFSSRVVNASCGDEVVLQARFEGGSAVHVAFEGVGCVISQAASSLLCGHIKSKNRAFIQSVDSQTMLTLIQMDVGPVRLKCVLLPLQALQAGMAEYTANKKG
jgi:nitrogen fixation NifU-like protein